MFYEFATLCILASASTIFGEPIVNTSYGRVQGIIRHNTLGPVIQFKRIPYATPPVGNYRFQKPIAHPSWNGILNATEYGPSCMQFFFQNDIWLLENKEMSEDCLHLNIFVPGGIDKSNPKAIMIWVHGGGYSAGQGTLFDGSYLALQGDVIVVTINYRLGLFGFLSTDDYIAKGNYGLWDQKMAFEWMHENAPSFGGDKNRITIFGESAGGFSVGLQSIIPSNRGYFQRVISQSGAVYSQTAVTYGLRNVAFKAGQYLNCTATNSSFTLLQCLRSKPAKDLLQIQNNEGMSTGPVIDRELIVGNPVDLLDDRRSASFQFFQSLDIMAGTNNAEGGLMYWSIMNYQEKYNFNISDGIPKEVLCQEVAPLTSKLYFHNNHWVTDAICKLYTVEGGSLAEQGRSTLNVYADVSFIIPTVQTLLAHVVQQPSQNTYHYIFSHKPTYPWIQERPPWLQGANHAGELPFVFGLDAMYPNTSVQETAELKLSSDMMKFWSNFAKTGNPNSGPKDDLPWWPPFEQTQRSYMNLTIDPTPGNHLYQERVKFWTETVPALLRFQDVHIPIVIFG